MTEEDKKDVESIVANALSRKERMIKKGVDAADSRYHRCLVMVVSITACAILLFFASVWWFSYSSHQKHLQSDLDLNVALQTCLTNVTVSAALCQTSTNSCGASKALSCCTCKEQPIKSVEAVLESRKIEFSKAYEWLRSELGEWIAVLTIMIAFFGVCVPIGTQLMQTKVFEESMKGTRTVVADANAMSKKIDRDFRKTVSQVETRFSQVETRFSQVETRFSQVETTLAIGLDKARGALKVALNADAAKKATATNGSAQSGEIIKTDSQQETNIFGGEKKESFSETAASEQGSVDVKYQEMLGQLDSPVVAFNYALQTRDIGFAEFLMPRLKANTRHEVYVRMVLGQAAAMGSAEAGDQLRKILECFKTKDCEYPLETRVDLIGCYVSYCNRRDLEPENLAFVRALVQETLEMCGEDADQAAQLHNQMQRMLYGVATTFKREGKPEAECQPHLKGAITEIQQAIELNPDEPAYYYNKAGCCRELYRLDEAIAAIDNCIERKTNDYDHYKMAYELHKLHGDDAKCREMATKMKELSPMRSIVDLA